MTEISHIETFKIFHKAYPGSKRGPKTEIILLKKHKDWEEVLPTLLPCLNNQLKIRAEKKHRKEWVPEFKNLKTYLNQRGWEIDNHDDIPQATDVYENVSRQVKTPQKAKTPEQLHEEKLKTMRWEDELNFLATGKRKYTDEQLNEPYKAPIEQQNANVE